MQEGSEEEKEEYPSVTDPVFEIAGERKPKRSCDQEYEESACNYEIHGSSARRRCG